MTYCRPKAATPRYGAAYIGERMSASEEHMALWCLVQLHHTWGHDLDLPSKDGK